VDFVETFQPEGAKCFYRGLFKGALDFFRRCFFPNMLKMMGNFGILSSKFYKGLGAL